MSFGPPPSIYTESARLADESRTRRRRRRIGGIAAAAVALCLGAGLVVRLQSGDDGKARTGPVAVKQAPDEIRATVEQAPGSPEGQLVVEHRQEKVAADGAYAPGMWATGKILARGIEDRIQGYKIVPGYDQTAWTLKLDGHLCATSRDVTADGRTAVVIQTSHVNAEGAKMCDEVLFLDLNTGKKVWQKTMPAADFSYVTNTNIALTKGVVAVAWGKGSVAYDMDSGKRLWNTTVASQCHDTGYAGGRALLSLVTCGQWSDRTYRVEKLNARTGKVLWKYQVGRGIQDVYLPSSDPPVVAVEAGDSEVTDLITLDAKSGERTATISMSGLDPKCGLDSNDTGYFGVVDKCDGIAVGRSRLFVMSKESYELDQPDNRIVAFDVRSGKTAGKFEGRPLQMVTPLRTSGDDLLIYRSTRDNVGPAAVVSWNPRTDKETPYLLFNLPSDEEASLSDIEDSDIVYEHGHVFFGPRKLERDDKSPTSPVLSAIGVGSAGLKH